MVLQTRHNVIDDRFLSEVNIKVKELLLVYFLVERNFSRTVREKLLKVNICLHRLEDPSSIFSRTFSFKCY